MPVQVAGDVFDIQMRYVTPLHARSTAGGANLATASCLAAAGAGHKGSGAFGLKGTAAAQHTIRLACL